MEPGLLTAYLALGLMAVLPIHIGAFASLKRLPKQRSRLPPSHPDYSSSEDEDQSETLSKEDAYWFPIIGSGVLFGLYLVFKFLNKEYVNYLLTAYFAIIGVAALAKSIESSFCWLTKWKEPNYTLRLVKRGKEFFKVKFTHVTLVATVVSLFGTAYYVATKNWIMSNLFGLAFATSAVQLIALDTFATGMILLMALFVYDIFWVFGTEVMVSVAKNFDAPIKVVFPKNLFDEKMQFTMLGLGDIVIPGVFVALSLRFDQWRRMSNLDQRGGTASMRSKTDFAKPYYTGCFIAYVLGLVTTVIVMHTFQAAQPALLYLSPACTCSVIIVALVRGEIKTLFDYKEEEKKPASAAAAAAVKKEGEEEEEVGGEEEEGKKVRRRKKKTAE